MPCLPLLLALVALPATQAFSSSVLPHAAPALRGSSVARSVTCSAGGVPGAASPLGRRKALGALAGGVVAGAGVLGAPGGAFADFEEFMAEKNRKARVQVRRRISLCILAGAYVCGRVEGQIFVPRASFWPMVGFGVLSLGRWGGWEG